jgi:hypothetical protein
MSLSLSPPIIDDSQPANVMHRENTRYSISCHHGDVSQPNNLEQAKKVYHNKGYEIDIYEVDFVCFCGRIVSAHDYDRQQISSGSSLEEWIDFFVVQKRKILWLDIKENITLVSGGCGYEKFDYRALFDVLEAKRQEVMRRFIDDGGDVDELFIDNSKSVTGLYPPLDIANYIVIGCQDAELHKKIANKSRQHKKRWRLILDSPDVWAYVLQYLCPGFLAPYLCDYVCEQFRQTKYRHYGMISIDQSFFSSRSKLIDFIKSLKLSPNTMVIVNSYDRTVPPLQIENHYIVMQYDYASEDFL